MREKCLTSKKNTSNQLLSIGLDIRKVSFHNKGDETLAQVAQRGGRYPIPGNIQGQVGRGSEQLIELKTSLLTAGGLG